MLYQVKMQAGKILGLFIKLDYLDETGEKEKSAEELKKFEQT